MCGAGELVVSDNNMKNLVLVICLVVINGCSSVPVTPYQTKYERTRGSLCNLYIELNGQWVKFYEDIGSYCLLQSQDGRYLVITDFRGSYRTRIKVFIVKTRQLVDITDWVHNRLSNISTSVYFIAHRFVNNEDVEIGINAIPKWPEEKPVAQALKKVRFMVNIHEAVEDLRYR